MLHQILFYVTLFFIGILGQAIHVCFVKIPSVKKDHAAANKPFDLNQYWKDDRLAIVANLLPILLWLFLIEETVKFYPGVANLVRFVTAFIGFTGSSVFIMAFGTASKKAKALLSIKSNVSDATVGKAVTVEGVIEKAKESSVIVAEDQAKKP